MEEFWILILVALFETNLLGKADSVQLEETPLKIIDEIFGEGWWDNDKAEEWHKLTLEQTFHHQIDRQNTQIRQIQPNSTDQNPHLTESDHFGQIKPNSTDQNLPLIESDSNNAKNGEEQIEIMAEENIAENERKRNIIDKFRAIKNEFKLKGNYSAKEWNQIEEKIGKHLKVSRSRIYKWKKEFGLNRRITLKKERKNLIEKFDQKKAELTRDGIKNSYSHEIDKTVAKELGLSFSTIYAWKIELGQISPKHIYSDSEQKELMKLYYEIKDKNPKIKDENIAKMLKIGTSTLYKWKKQFKRQQIYPNSVDGHSVEENAAANVREIENINSESI